MRFRKASFLVAVAALLSPALALAKDYSFIVVNDSSKKIRVIYKNEDGKTLVAREVAANGGRWERDEDKPGWGDVLERAYRIQSPNGTKIYARGLVKFATPGGAEWGDLTTTQDAREAKLLIDKWKSKSGDVNKTLHIKDVPTHTH